MRKELLEEKAVMHVAVDRATSPCVVAVRAEYWLSGATTRVQQIVDSKELRISFHVSSMMCQIIPAKPPRDKGVCQHCHMQVVEVEQHFSFDCPLFKQIRDQHEAFWYHGSIRLFLQRNAAQMSSVAQYTHLCSQARMSDESHLAPQNSW